MSLADDSLIAAAASVRSGSVSARDLVDSVLDRAASTESSVHAFSALQADRARAQAAVADRSQPRGRLHGVPVAIKDVFDVEGLPVPVGSTSTGSMAEDAPAVRSLRDSGAIILGVTSAQQLGLGADVPATRNAWDQTRAPGGSSAGSAVAVAVGSAYAALGTDTGGSVRVPAALNGVVGFKPTFGLIDASGAIPLSRTLDTVGILARSATDCEVVFEILSGLDEKPADFAPRLPAVGAVRSHGLFVDPLVAEVVAAALSVLTQTGVELGEVDWVRPHLVTAVGTATVFAGAASEHSRLLADPAAGLDPATRVLLAAACAVPSASGALAARLRTVVLRDVEAMFASGPFDVLAMPSFPVSPGPPDRVAGTGPAMASAVAIQMLANLAGLPAVTVPCGFTPDGLPVGLQLVGRAGSDHEVLGLAAAYQERAPWHARSPLAGSMMRNGACLSQE